LNPIGLLLFPLRRTRTLAVTNVAQLAIRILLNVLFIPIYGAFGVALAEIISKFAVSPLVIGLICYDVYTGSSDSVISEQKSGATARDVSNREGE